MYMYMYSLLCDCVYLQYGIDFKLLYMCIQVQVYPLSNRSMSSDPHTVLYFPPQDIQLRGLGIANEHCIVEIAEREVFLTPVDKALYVH